MTSQLSPGPTTPTLTASPTSNSTEPTPMILGFEDFDEADALLAFLDDPEDSGGGVETSPGSGGSANAPRHWRIDLDKYVGGKDLSTLYETGMMKSVHMEIQENAKISNLNPAIAIDRSNGGGVLPRAQNPLSPNSANATSLAEKFLRSGQRCVI